MIAKKKKTCPKKSQKVYVAVSGGVDSSVSLALLKEQGYDVVGVFIRVWQPNFLECNWKEDKRDAMRVCAHLGVQFLEFNFEKEYKKEVADYMIEEYKIGRTPNPDVMCNQQIKFGTFLKKALEMGTDFIATGHYAKIESHKAGRYLLVGKDTNKDQSYFLWTLTQEQLKYVLFPIGGYQKKEVRKLAKKFKLLTAEKKDSQGLCFLGKLNVKDFLKHYIKEKPGKVLDQDGKIIGKHSGAVFFTLGERHGFKIFQKSPNEQPRYIVGKNIKKNTITVSSILPSPFSPRQHPYKLEYVRISKVNWVVGRASKTGEKLSCQTRYHGEHIPCCLSNVSIGKKTATAEFSEPVLAVPGQSLVLYDGSILLGGGIID